ncbi:MAG TPA: DUF418 domain-containing protein [Lysobacter sp.]
MIREVASASSATTISFQAAMTNPLVQPLSLHQRTPIIDILRGWALLGVAIGNFSALHHLGADPERQKDTLTTVLEYAAQYLFSAKSWTLLSILFGYGFSVLIRNIADTTGRPVSFFLKRMLWLLALACINSLFFFGDILRDYALLGVLLLAFQRSSTKTIFRAGVLLMLIVPFVSAYVRNLGISYQADVDAALPLFHSRNWLDVFQFNAKATVLTEILNPNYAVTVHVVMFACMLMGVAAHRSGFLHQLATDRNLARRIFWTSLPLAIVLNAALGYLNKEQASVLTYFRFGYWGVISTTLAIASGICWLYQDGRLRSLGVLLQAMGRMTLTNYMTQCILLAVIFSGAGLGLANAMPYWFHLVLAIGIYTIQVFVSRWWLSNFQHGPVEWLWRALSYGPGITPIKRAKAAVPG